MYLENQSITTLQTIIDQICDFAVANAGFTSETSLSGSGITNCITNMRILSKGGMYWYFYGVSEDFITPSPTRTEGGIYFKMQKDIPTLSNYLNTTVTDAQRWRTLTSVWQQPIGPFAGLNLYSNNLTGNNDGTYVSAVIETLPNVFTHLTFGSMDKYGDWIGGEVSLGNYNSQFSSTTGYPTETESNYASLFMSSRATGNIAGTVYARFPSYGYRPHDPAEGDAKDYQPIGLSGYRTYYSSEEGLYFRAQNLHYSVTYTMIEPIFDIGPNAVNLRAPLMPSYFMMPWYSGAADLMYLAGNFEAIKLVNMNALQPKEIVDVDWIVYPTIAKSGDRQSNPISNDSGIAYKRIS